MKRSHTARIALLLSFAAALGGCGSSRDQVAQRNNDQCAARGLQPNTDAFAECVTRLETERDVRMSQRHRDMVEGVKPPPRW